MKKSVLTKSVDCGEVRWAKAEWMDEDQTREGFCQAVVGAANALGRGITQDEFLLVAPDSDALRLLQTLPDFVPAETPVTEKDFVRVGQWGTRPVLTGPVEPNVILVVPPSADRRASARIRFG
jgi:hypothetical protein